MPTDPSKIVTTLSDVHFAQRNPGTSYATDLRLMGDFPSVDIADCYPKEFTLWRTGSPYCPLRTLIGIKIHKSHPKRKRGLGQRKRRAMVVYGWTSRSIK